MTWSTDLNDKALARVGATTNAERERMRFAAQQLRLQAENDAHYGGYYRNIAKMLEHAADGRLSSAFEIARRQLEEANMHSVNMVLKALHAGLEKEWKR